MFQRLLACVRGVLEIVWRVECVRDARLPLARLTPLGPPLAMQGPAYCDGTPNAINRLADVN